MNTWRFELRSKSGSTILVMMLSCMLVLLGIGTFATDIGHNVVVRTELQNAVDAAALAGVKDLIDPANWNSGASDFDALQVCKSNSADGRAVANSSPGTTVSVTSVPPSSSSQGSCTVNASMVIDNTLARLVDHNFDTVNVSSTAYVGSALSSPKGALLPVIANISSFMNGGAPLPAGSPVTLRFSADNNSDNAHFTTFSSKANTNVQVQVQAQWDPPGASNQIQTQLQGPVANPGYATQVQVQTQGVQAPGWTCQYQVQIQSHFDDSAQVQKLAQYQLQGNQAGIPSPATSIGQTVAFTSGGDPAMAAFLQNTANSGQVVTFPVYMNSKNGSAPIVAYATVKLSGATVTPWYNGQLTDVQLQGTLQKPISWSGIKSGVLPATGMSQLQYQSVSQINPVHICVGK